MPGDGSRPFLSAIVPTFNGAAFVSHSLASVAEQADAGVEVIAIDDGSTDGTRGILGDFEGRMNLRIHERPPGGNWVARVNEALGEARGEYACILPQDDLWLPGRLAALRDATARWPEATFLFSSARFIDAGGRDVGPWRAPLVGGSQLAGPAVLERLLVQNFVALPAAAFRREAVAAHGLDETLWYAADWDLWLRLATSGPTAYLPQPTAAFRLHAGSQTTQRSHRSAERERQLRAVLDRHGPALLQHPRARQILRHAEASLRLNVALAAWSSGHGGRREALRALVSLPPWQWPRFARSTRLVERVASRWRAGLAGGVLPGRSAENSVD